MDTFEIIFPQDEQWDGARRAWNLAVDQQPAAVALPKTAEEVASAIRYARAGDLRVVPQSTGHSASPLGDLSDALLLKTERLRDVTIDAERAVARAGGGAVWGEVTKAAAGHGLAALAGSSHDVGVAGYHLGGGISWLARKYGLASNSVTAVELVTADGHIVRADADNHAELFWSLRGGGGNFGVVTALEFRLYPIREVFAGSLFFPVERLTEVVSVWREWVDTVSDDVTSIARFMQFPPLPAIPEHLRGKSFAVVQLASTDANPDLVRPLRRLDPAIDTVATMPVENLDQVHFDPPGPVPGIGDGMLLTDAPADALAVLQRGTSLLSVELRHLGGELARSREGSGALASIDAPFALFAVGAAPTPELAAAVEADVESVKAAFAPWDAGRTYLNFADKPQTGKALFGDSFHRLREVKAAYDPENLFRANHPIAPAHPRRERPRKTHKVLTVS